ncbi:hypothetical protein [Actinomycetospora soli]|uniref:hypothetical protein n=1 Tax=Actinomycetospora soli TaxID=2893887 RepID=UPI001E426E51|nr:hypothetical protein [Actinomycetospora soli]MCD2189708.1 hypothetical protein [Actinomycetospora soli]
MEQRTAQASQGVVALVGITLGVVPLAQRLVTGSTGSLRQLLPGGGASTAALVATLVVVIGAVLGIAVLERSR